MKPTKEQLEYWDAHDMRNNPEVVKQSVITIKDAVRNIIDNRHSSPEIREWAEKLLVTCEEYC